RHTRQGPPRIPRNQNPIASVFDCGGVGDKESANTVRHEIEARIDKIAQHRFLNVECLPRVELDAEVTGVAAIDIKSSERDDVIAPRADCDSHASGRQYTCYGAITGDSDSFGNVSRTIIS